jgi:hypothetical protein
VEKMETIRPGFVNPCIVKVYRGIIVDNNSYKKYEELNHSEVKKLIEKQKNTYINYFQ